MEGDDNTNFFHKFSNGRKAINTIWKLTNDQENTVHTFQQLASLATTHFKYIYQAPPNATISEVIRVAQLFPQFFDRETTLEFNREVSMGELEATLKWFKRDKSPRPYGWLVEFYTTFFAILGDDLLKVIEDCRTTSRMLGAINTTFITLIPKSDNPTSFDDFHPISLCNFIYKIIANCLRPILSNHISSEQFSFLQDRQIHEAVGTTQEAWSSITLKSTITTIGCTLHEIQFALHQFPFTLLQLEDGLRYLGYRLKPHGCKIAEWTWLISKLERRLNIWYHKYLSRAGRIVLIKVVLEATPVYWMSLPWIPRGILTRIQNLCCRFLWKGKQTGRIFAWANWELLTLPKKWGGWGIKKLEYFSSVMATKLGWQLITSNNLWTMVASSKYIAPLNIMDCLRQTSCSKIGISVIWKAMLNSMPLIRDGLTWRIQASTSVRIELDPWIGGGNAHNLPEELNILLANLGITHISHVTFMERSTLFH
eukprot:PITA_08617